MDDETNPDDVLRNEALIFEPEYWENLAEQKRKMAVDIRHPKFSAALNKIAESYDSLAREAFKLRQQRRVMFRLEPANKARFSDTVVRLKTGTDKET